MSEDPRELTTEEVRERFLNHVHALVDYWERESRQPKLREKLEGLAFSILSALDGCAALPGFSVVPHPHSSDKEFLRQKDENWYPPYPSDCDIAGCLHELFFRPQTEKHVAR